MDCIRQLRLVPREIRSDRGTENTIICGIQRFLRRNAEDLISNKNSFVYGSSTHNQRIECWWSILRRSRLNWWINLFKDISAENILDTSLTYHVEFLRFCFLGILQEELDETRRLWNNHFVRKSRNAECPEGRPDVLFYTPSLVGGRDCRLPFVEADVNLALPYCEAPEHFGSSDYIVDFAALIMNEGNITMPRTPHQAKELFITLLQNVDSVWNVFLFVSLMFTCVALLHK